MMKRLRGGFTLVELIVVIAILGVLAGVAVPVYNGYIQKARKAADDQLLSAVNSAFAAACLENGESNRGQIAALLLKDDRSVRGVSVADAKGSQINDAFIDRYFKGNEDQPFQYYEKKDILYDEEQGIFRAEKIGMKTLVHNGNTVTYNEGSVQAYKDSNFSKINVRKTTMLVDSLINSVGSDSTVTAYLTNDEAFKKYLESKGLDTTNSQVARGLVTYAAEKMSSVSAAEVIANLTGDFGEDLRNMYSVVSGGKTPTFSDKAVSAAVMYAMTASFSQSDAGAAAGMTLPDGSVHDLGTLTTYMASMTDTQKQAYKAYLASDEGKKDAAGLIGVLSTVNDNSDLVLQYVKDGDGKFNTNDTRGLVTAILNAVGE